MMDDLGDFLDFEDFEGGERSHSVLGASSSDRWMNCPGSIAMSEGMPNKSSIFAMEGTAAHHLGELCLRQGVNAYAFDGKYITYHGELLDEMPAVYNPDNPAFEINDDTPKSMIPAVNVYLDYIARRMEEVEKLYGVKPELLIEEAFDLSSVYPGMYGYNDVSIYIPMRFLESIDYKHGEGKIVEIQNNSQIKYYGLGGLIKLCPTEFDEPDQIVTTVVQPRAAHRDGPIRSASYSSEYIRVGFAQELREAAERTTEPDAPLKQGSWCFFCRGKVKCPEFSKKQRALSSVDMYDLTEEDLADPKALVTKMTNAVTVDPAKIGQALDFFPMLKSWMNAVEAYALDMHKSGTPIPGQKLVHGNKHRIYHDEAVAAKTLVAKGLPEDQIWEPRKLKSPSQIEKLRPEGLKPKEIKEIVKSVAYKPQGELELAPLTDNRTEVPLSAIGVDIIEGEFEVLDTGDFDIL